MAPDQESRKVLLYAPFSGQERSGRLMRCRDHPGQAGDPGALFKNGAYSDIFQTDPLGGIGRYGSRANGPKNASI